MPVKRLIQNLTDEKSKREKSLTSGQAQSFDSYKFLVGQIKGLEDAINISKNIFTGEIDD